VKSERFAEHVSGGLYTRSRGCVPESQGTPTERKRDVVGWAAFAIREEDNDWLPAGGVGFLVGDHSVRDMILLIGAPVFLHESLRGR